MACNGRPERQGEEAAPRRVVRRVEHAADRQPQYEARDLRTQLEDLLDQVWRSGADWRFNDRLDLALHGLPSAVRQEGSGSWRLRACTSWIARLPISTKGGRQS
jgi:hypothetical protein